MKTSEQIMISKCCNYKTSTVPGGFGTSTFTICDKCMKECDVDFIEVQTHVQISRGQYRPTFNKRKYGFKG